MSNCTKNEDLLKIFPAVLRGAEGEEDGSNDGDDGQNNDDGQNDGGENGQQQEQDKDKEKDPNAGLHSALQKERKRAADAEKELKRLRKAKEDADLAEKTELEQAQTRLQASETRIQGLAASLLTRDINDAIRKAAATAKFIDVDDAVAGVNRNELVYEQDEEDPTQITIDEKAVVKAVKDLATKKPHFIRSGTEDGEPSGSQFGGGKGGTKEDREKVLRSKYSALGNASS